MSVADRSGAAFTLSKRAEPSLLISPRAAQSQGVGGLWKPLLSQSIGSSGNAMPSKRLDPATSNVIVFHPNPDVILAPKDSVDANIILNVSSDLLSAFS
ncbi:hypothetical protein NQZ68_035164 [Dissostichus eleginoides]|nr:hypothetical protein NQZ68_035164 [Dissostichus eleginoides]